MANKKPVKRAKKSLPSRKQMEKSVRRKHSSGRFVVTCVPARSKVNANLVQTLISYCTQQDAKLIILLSRSHNQAMQKQDEYYDRIVYELKDSGIATVLTEYEFNDSLVAVDMQINPQQKFPLVGLGNYLHPRSILVASPKMHMQLLPTGNNTPPRMLHSTGTIGLPDYQKNRIGRMANEDHTMGALVVEISKDSFQVRQLQADKRDCIVDLGTRYAPDGQVATERAEAVILGDIHAGFHDAPALKCWGALIQSLKPRKLFLHDLFSGESINHHNAKNMMAKLSLPETSKTLEGELAITRLVAASIAEKMPADGQVYIVDSNHDAFLERYLNERRFSEDHVNYRTAISAEYERVILGRNPLRTAVDPTQAYTWLDGESDLRVEGIQMAAHGHASYNGMRGSKAALYAAHGNVFTGHTHSPAIQNGVWTVGTSSLLRMGYNGGASTWSHTSGIVYKGGARQLISVVKNKYRF